MDTRDSGLSMSYISNGATSLIQINLVKGTSPDSGESHADTVIAEGGWNRFSACLNERKTMGMNAYKWLQYNPWVMTLTKKVCPVVPQMCLLLKLRNVEDIRLRVETARRSSMVS